jgi:hypothetical protein
MPGRGAPNNTERWLLSASRAADLRPPPPTLPNLVVQKVHNQILDGSLPFYQILETVHQTPNFPPPSCRLITAAMNH